MKKLERCKDGIICGVCGGMADYLGMDRTLVRVLYVFFALFTNIIAVIGYVACAFLMPLNDDNIIDV